MMHLDKGEPASKASVSRHVVIPKQKNMETLDADLEQPFRKDFHFFLPVLLTESSTDTPQGLH